MKHLPLTRTCLCTFCKLALDCKVRRGLQSGIYLHVFMQIFINGEFVGGSDILMGMHQSGELQPLLDEAMTTKSAQ